MTTLILDNTAGKKTISGTEYLNKQPLKLAPSNSDSAIASVQPIKSNEIATQHSMPPPVLYNPQLPFDNVNLCLFTLIEWNRNSNKFYAFFPDDSSKTNGLLSKNSNVPAEISNAISRASKENLFKCISHV